MTIRQKILRSFYPLLMLVARRAGKNATVTENRNTTPVTSIHDLPAKKANGENFNMCSGKGKKMLIVNTASDCGYTQQYAELEELYKQYQQQLTILAFPSNEFRQQEKGSEEEILSFCRVNYGVTFPVMEKALVLPSPDQHPVYQWLTDPGKNGWNAWAPEWNFSKYLIDENGKLVGYYGSSVSPLSPGFIKAVNS